MGRGFVFLTVIESVLQLFVVPVLLAVDLGFTEPVCTRWPEREEQLPWGPGGIFTTAPKNWLLGAA